MNNERRKQLKAIAESIETHADALSDLIGELESLKDEEQEYFDGMPESFQNGTRGEKAQAAIDALDNAIQAIDTDGIRESVNSINEAIE